MKVFEGNSAVTLFATMNINETLFWYLQTQTKEEWCRKLDKLNEIPMYTLM